MRKYHLLFIVFWILLEGNAQTSYAFDSIPSSLLKHANAIVRNASISIEVLALDKMKIKVKKIVTIKNELGDMHSSVVVHYGRNTKIKSIKTIIYDRNGLEIKKVKSKDYKDVSAVSGGTLYGDSRIQYYTYIPVDYPYTIYYEYELQTSNTALIPNWYPVSYMNTSVEYSSYSVQNFIGGAFKHLNKNFENFTITSDITATGVSCSLQDFSAIKEEELSGGIKNKVPSMLVHLESFSAYGTKGSFSNWNEFGEWMNASILTDNSNLSKHTISEVLALTSGIENERERARLVYEYMQGKMRYISVQVGIGGIQPEKVMTVDRLAYGDCKGLCVYTKKLLELVNVPAHYVVVQAGRNIEGFEKDFPSVEQGNHIILNLPLDKEDVWLECTNMNMPFGFLGDFTDDRNVIVVTKEGGEIKKTPTYKTANNVQLTIAEVFLSATGSVKGNVEITSTGIQYDQHFHLEMYDQERLQKHYKENYWDYINNLTLGAVTLENDKKNVVFKEGLSFEIGGYLQSMDDKVFFDVNVFNKFTRVPKKYRERIYNFEKQRGWRDEETIKIEIPNSYSLVSVPKEVEISNEFGLYSMSLEKVSEKVFLYKRIFQLNKGVYSKEKYKHYRKFIKQVIKYDQSKLVLTTRKI
ncbi:MAG: DUF3857 domain-containing protein [Flavobacteriaceae bacterium]|nr:DUF3857 domain-containing protein [Flavobacteriaceae bacterium]